MDAKNSQQALSQLQKQQSAALNPNDILTQQRQGLGVNEAQQTVTGLRGAINNTTKLLQQVAPSVMGRTGSSLVTNAQATRQIANEQAPISQNLTQQGQDYTQAAEDLAQLQQRAQEAASGIYQGQQDKLSYLQNLYTTLYNREEAARQAKIAAEAEKRRQYEWQKAYELQQQSEARQARAAASGGVSLGGYTGSGSTGAAKSNPTKQRAQADVAQLMNRRGTTDFYREVYAINQSAGYGNAYDRAKLELLKATQPGLFKGGKLNTDYVSRLINMGGSGGSGGGGW